VLSRCRRSAAVGRVHAPSRQRGRADDGAADGGRTGGDCGPNQATRRGTCPPPPLAAPQYHHPFRRCTPKLIDLPLACHGKKSQGERDKVQGRYGATAARDGSGWAAGRQRPGRWGGSGHTRPPWRRAQRRGRARASSAAAHEVGGWVTTHPPRQQSIPLSPQRPFLSLHAGASAASASPLRAAFKLASTCVQFMLFLTRADTWSARKAPYVM